jgi:ABC-type phosphate/phosphonate transport system permease subunit
MSALAGSPRARGAGSRAPRGARPRARRLAVGWRAAVVLLLALAALAAWLSLDASLADLVPRRGSAAIVRAFFARALSPAFDYETQPPEGTPPLWLQALGGARRTLVFAAAGMSLALVIGAVLGFFGSSAWWAGDPVARERGGAVRLRHALAPAVWAATRVVIVGMRSVHELLWAVLFLAAFGLNHATAVVAIAIPYGGTLAKIFSEMIDEAPPDAANALRAAGASPLQVFCFGLVPRALPDVSAYAFYRFECAVRSSAVLGFFGFPTLGYFVAASFENLHFGEVWSYLYTLAALVVAIELWSSALRRRFVA